MEHIERKAQKSNATLAICITALFMALNIMMSSFGLPVPGGHLYLNDVIICTAAILLDDPKAAFIVGGVGAFLGDLFFYPTPMFVSLVTHGIQAVVICQGRQGKLQGRCSRRNFRRCYYGCGLFSGTCFYLQHTALCLHQAALPDSAGSSRRCRWPDSLLQSRSAGALRQNVPQIIFTANTKAVVRKQTYNSFFICVCALPRLGQQTTDHNILL